MCSLNCLPSTVCSCSELVNVAVAVGTEVAAPVAARVAATLGVAVICALAPSSASTGALFNAAGVVMTLRVPIGEGVAAALVGATVATVVAAVVAARVATVVEATVGADVAPVVAAPAG